MADRLTHLPGIARTADCHFFTQSDVHPAPGVALFVIEKS